MDVLHQRVVTALLGKRLCQRDKLHLQLASLHPRKVPRSFGEEFDDAFVPGVVTTADFFVRVDTRAKVERHLVLRGILGGLRILASGNRLAAASRFTGRFQRLFGELLACEHGLDLVAESLLQVVTVTNVHNLNEALLVNNDRHGNAVSLEKIAELRLEIDCDREFEFLLFEKLANLGRLVARIDCKEGDVAISEFLRHLIDLRQRRDARAAPEPRNRLPPPSYLSGRQAFERLPPTA